MTELRPDVTLATLSLEHAERMLEWVREPSVARNIGLRSEPSFERTVEWIEKSKSSDDVFAFAILVGGAHVGNVILDRVDRLVSSARFSIYIGDSEKRGSGIGRTATVRVCQFGFDKLSLNKIWLTVHARNFRGINSYTKAGFRLEGIMRDEFLLGDERLDALYMGLLKREFEMPEVRAENAI